MCGTAGQVRSADVRKIHKRRLTVRSGVFKPPRASGADFYSGRRTVQGARGCTGVRRTNSAPAVSRALTANAGCESSPRAPHPLARVHGVDSAGPILLFAVIILLTIRHYYVYAYLRTQYDIR